MGWSPLSTEVHSTSQYSARTRSPAGVVLHHGATTSADAIISMEVTGSRQVSSHQVVKDARNAGIVQEQFRAWSLSDAYWDSWAFTVECANENTNGWTISAASHETLAQLVADWAKRYGFYPQRSGDPRNWTVYGHREIYTIFEASYATACPGGMDLDWITNRAQQILAGAKPKRRNEMYIVQDVQAGGSFLVTDQGVEGVDGGDLSTINRMVGNAEDFKGTPLYTSEITNLDKKIRSAVKRNQTGGGGGSTDLTPVLNAIAEVPTAAENGAAARAAIVK